MYSPTYQDILAARTIVSRYLPRTPVYHSPGLSRLLGCELFIKHENHLPTGAFKVRGGVNCLASLSSAEKARGVITATRGNHGLSVAYAARLFGTQAVLVVPHGNNPEKNAGMSALGAEVIEHGKDFDEAREYAASLVASHGYHYLHPANEPRLIAGVGTYAVELFEDLPHPDVVIVPVGLGSGICGVALVRAQMSPSTAVIGVQAERAPAVYLSWKAKRTIVTESADTVADGLATRVPAELTQALINRLVDDMVTVSEEAILEAIRLLLFHTHNLAEGAGAAALAAALQLRERLAGRQVVIILSGGNIDAATLRRVLHA
ncbi:MAG: threonine dehydratase [Candidatus Binatia bacterium]|nr:threonine dehydratase [Candidatus Binatia bacterium]